MSVCVVMAIVIYLTYPVSHPETLNVTRSNLCTGVCRENTRGDGLLI